MKCAIYICQCGYRMEVPFRELKKHYQFNEEDLSSFPKIECDWFPDPDFPEFMD